MSSTNPWNSYGVPGICCIFAKKKVMMNEELKKLIFWKRNDLEEALRLPLCNRLYCELKEKEGEATAKDEALALCNDVLWSIFIEEFADLTWDRKYPIPVTGKCYDWRWVMAQLTDTNCETYYVEEIGDNSRLFLEDCICESQKAFDFNPWDEELLELYRSIRGKTIHTWPKLLDFARFIEVERVANVNHWPPLFEIRFFELPSKLRIFIIDDLSRKCLTYKDALLLRDLLEEYVYHFSNFEFRHEYCQLCRVIVEIQKFEKIKHSEAMKKVESEVLELKRGNKVLNTEGIRDYLISLINLKIIPTGNKHGYEWYAVWLFFKNKALLKKDTQSSFERLMEAWFPKCGYGRSEQMRRYNSKYLEDNRWQVWKYIEFRKTAQGKTTEKGFNSIQSLYHTLDTYMDLNKYWIKLY